MTPDEMRPIRDAVLDAAAQREHPANVCKDCEAGEPHMCRNVKNIQPLSDRVRVAAARVIAADGEAEFTAIHYGRLAADAVMAVVAPALEAAEQMADGLRAALNACQRRQMEVLHERDEARAAVERVWALCDKSDRLLPGSVPSPGYLATWQVRAAMDGEPGDKEEA